MGRVGETTETGEDIDKSDEIASVTECIPVDCVAVCCSPSPLLGIDVPSPTTWAEVRVRNSECVDGQLREEGPSRVGVLAASTGNGSEASFERVSMAPSWVTRTLVPLLDTTLVLVALLVAKFSNNRRAVESFSRAWLSACHMSHFHSSR